MALTLETIVNEDLPNIPTGATIPAQTITFTGGEFKVTAVYTVATAGIADATASTGFDQLVAALDTYISGTFVPDTLGLDTTGNNYNAVAEMRTVARNNASDGIYSTTDQYQVTFTLTAEIV